MEIRNHEFEHGGMIPVRHTCDGARVSPSLLFHDVPDEASSLALIMDDPDAPGGTFTHWLMWNMPPSIHQVSEGTRPEGVMGKNDFGDIDYGPPCPPEGTHRYRFRLYALDDHLDLHRGADREQLEGAMQGHIIDRTELVGRYTRRG
jgi:hypothetical protein